MDERAPVMTMEEIEATYDGEWVVIDEPIVEPGPILLGGRVVFHDPDMDTASDAAQRLARGHNALLFIGEGEPIGDLNVIGCEISSRGVRVATGSRTELVPGARVPLLRALGRERRNIRVLAHQLPPESRCEVCSGSTSFGPARCATISTGAPWS